MSALHVSRARRSWKRWKRNFRGKRTDKVLLLLTLPCLRRVSDVSPTCLAGGKECQLGRVFPATRTLSTLVPLLPPRRQSGDHSSIIASRLLVRIDAAENREMIRGQVNNNAPDNEPPCSTQSPGRGMPEGFPKERPHRSLQLAAGFSVRVVTLPSCWPRMSSRLACPARQDVAFEPICPSRFALSSAHVKGVSAAERKMDNVDGPIPTLPDGCEWLFSSLATSLHRDLPMFRRHKWGASLPYREDLKVGNVRDQFSSCVSTL